MLSSIYAVKRVGIYARAKRFGTLDVRVIGALQNLIIRGIRVIGVVGVIAVLRDSR